MVGWGGEGVRGGEREREASVGVVQTQADGENLSKSFHRVKSSPLLLCLQRGTY